MALFVKRAFKNAGSRFDEWKLVKLSDKEEREIKRKTFEDNLATYLYVKSEIRKKEAARKAAGETVEPMTENEIMTIFGTVSRHYHYNAENYIDEKMFHGTLPAESIQTVPDGY